MIAIHTWFGPGSRWAIFGRVLASPPASIDGAELISVFKMGFEANTDFHQVRNVLLRNFFEAAAKLYQESMSYLCF